jgi:hypothetical protein
MTLQSDNVLGDETPLSTGHTEDIFYFFLALLTFLCL